jgi:hypothetical protein
MGRIRLKSEVKRCPGSAVHVRIRRIETSLQHKQGPRLNFAQSNGDLPIEGRVTNLRLRRKRRKQLELLRNLADPGVRALQGGVLREFIEEYQHRRCP